MFSSAPQTVDLAEIFERSMLEAYPVLVEHQAAPDPRLIACPAVIDIRRETFEAIAAAVQGLFRLRGLPAYQRAIRAADEELLRFDPGNASVLMGYDFHITPEGRPYLIEINTNAAFSLGADVLNHCRGLANPFSAPFVDALQRSFFAELGLALDDREARTVAIIDENYRTQHFYFEFLMFKQLFESWGWQCVIGEPREFEYSEKDARLRSTGGEAIDLVYNRLCDFLLDDPRHLALRRAYLGGRTCFSPNPHEYLLLADKQRLVEISRPGWLEATGLEAGSIEAIRRVVPVALDMETHPDPDQLWQQRKELFFKPKRSYGGKGVFRGARISRRHFEQIVHQPYIAQQYIPPGLIHIPVPPGAAQEFKYDVRFLAYRDEMQLMIARVYQGQVTNLKTPSGGFAGLRLVP